MTTAASQVTGDLPRHVAIIMDGNNRWAKARQLKPQDGHSRGAEVARKIVAACVDRNIPYLTLFAFSSENWLRPQTEVRALMALFLKVLRRDEITQLHAMGVRIRFIGNRSSFSKALQKGMLEVEKRTEANLKTTVFVAVDYGGRWDIAQAVSRLVADLPSESDIAGSITAATLHQYTSLAEAPDPDLCIRTGGERRLSNFLLWQLAYTELYFCDTYWPDFNEAELQLAIDDYASRQRRFGGQNACAPTALGSKKILRCSPMLKQRIATAIVLLVGLIAMTTSLGLEAFAAVTGALVLIGAWEWAAFASLGSKSRLAFVGTLALSIALLSLALGLVGENGYDASVALGFSLLGALFWALMFGAIVSFPESTEAWNDKSRISVMGMLSLLGTWVGLVTLKALLPSGALVIMLIIMVAAVDVGAFFTGKLFGKRKLAPALSPNKTWEGVWGGVALNLIVSLAFALLLDKYVQAFAAIDYAIFAALALIVAFFSVVGDLAESMLKRNRELKDSGSILPGHGGLLDRIDGLMAATPICVAVLILLLGGV